jgi:hypothetical protein
LWGVNGALNGGVNGGVNAGCAPSPVHPQVCMKEVNEECEGGGGRGNRIGASLAFLIGEV